MPGIVRPFGILLCALALLPPLKDAGAQTEDPSPAPDPRLARKVTYPPAVVTLQKLAEDLTKQTGVVIRVGSVDRDWRVKERKVHVSLTDLPLGTALAQVAKTLGYDLRRNGQEGSWAYRIWQTSRSRDYEEVMRLSQAEEKDRDIAAIQESVLKDAESALAMTPEEAKRLTEDDPWKAYLGGTESGRALAEVLTGIPPDARELMLRGREVTLEASEMPPAFRDALGRASKPGRLRLMMAGGTAPDTGGGDMQEELNRQVAEMLAATKPSRITFNVFAGEGDDDRPAALGWAGLAVINSDLNSPGTGDMPEGEGAEESSGGMPVAMIPLAGSKTPMSAVLGKMMMRLESGEDPQAFDQAMEEINDPAFFSLVAGSGPSAPPPTEPALLTEIEPYVLKERPDAEKAEKAEKSGDADEAEQDDETEDPKKSDDRFLSYLTEKTKLSFIIEHFDGDGGGAPPLGFFLPRTRQPLYKILDSLRPAGYGWEYGEGVVRIRPVDWAIQRSYEVPESFLDGYRKLLRARRQFDLETLAAILAPLSDDQFNRRFFADPELRLGTADLDKSARELVRLYGSLTPTQKARLTGKEGLSFESLSPDQWQRVATVIDAEKPNLEVAGGTLQLASVEDSSDEQEDSPDPEGAEPAEKPQARSEKAATTPAPPKAPVGAVSDLSGAGGLSGFDPDRALTYTFTLTVRTPDSGKPVVLNPSFYVPYMLTKEEQKQVEKAKQGRAKHGMEDAGPGVKPERAKTTPKATPDRPQSQKAKPVPSAGKAAPKKPTTHKKAK